MKKRYIGIVFLLAWIFILPSQVFAKPVSEAELKKEIQQIQEKCQILEAENKEKQKEYKKLSSEVDILQQALKQKLGGLENLSQLLQVAAKDTDQILRQGYRRHTWSEQLDPYVRGEVPANIEGFRLVLSLLEENIRQSSECRIAPGIIIDKSGKEVPADILTIGNLTAAYRAKGEVGFLLTSEQGEMLFKMEKSPGFFISRNLKKYMNNKADAVYIDTAHGVALRQLVTSNNLWDKIKSGGPVIWPILLIGLLALIIVVNRLLFLRKSQVDADSLMQELDREIKAKNWQAAYKVAQLNKTSALGRVLLTGIQFVGNSREDMENGLQEAILNEIPPMEYFLSTLGMLASIAPLLGLLGTVTGMINTFHAITFFGSGDPKFLSGGISEALITTMLGLSIAIPIMVCHTFISRQIETRIAQLEEKAVSLVNAIYSVETK